MTKTRLYVDPNPTPSKHMTMEQYKRVKAYEMIGDARLGIPDRMGSAKFSVGVIAVSAVAGVIALFDKAFSRSCRDPVRSERHTADNKPSVSAHVWREDWY